MAFLTAVAERKRALPQGPGAKAGIPGNQVAYSHLYSSFGSPDKGQDGKMSRASLVMTEVWKSLALQMELEPGEKTGIPVCEMMSLERWG